MRKLLLILTACGSSSQPAAEVPKKPEGLVVMGELERAVPTYTITLLADHRGCMFTDNKGYEDGDMRVPLGVQVRLQVSHWEPDGNPTAAQPVSVTVGTAKVTLKNHAADSIHFVVESQGTYKWSCNDVPLAMIVMPKAELDKIVNAADELASPTTTDGKIALGKVMYQKKGCVACHTIDGSPRIGPSWKGIWGTKVKGAAGDERTIDETYVKESINTPQAFTVAGFPAGVMPTFDGQLRDVELDSIVAFIQSLK
ncbi:MAG: c-type cytochrome [Kofleriaceae bacterium]